MNECDQNHHSSWLQLAPAAVHSFEHWGYVSVLVRSLTIIYNKTLYQQTFYQAGHNVGRYRQMLQVQHQEYLLAPYLFALENFRSRRLVSRFRCGCHVYSGQIKPVAQYIGSSAFVLSVLLTQQKMQNHFVFDCPAYRSSRDRFTTIFWGPAPTLSSFFTLHEHMCTGSLPTFYMNVLHTGTCHQRVFRGAAAQMACQVPGKGAGLSAFTG